MTKRILLTGTHLTPALELIRQLQQDKKIDWQISYIGRESSSNEIKNTSIESKIIPSTGVNFCTIPCGKLDRRYLPNTLVGIPKTILGFIKSFKLIKAIKPDIVISFGGYVSVPIIITSFLKGIKSITHEQTLTNSLTTKINSRFVTKVALSFDNQKQINQLPQEKVVVTGNLLRYQLFQKPKKPKLFTNKLLTNKLIIYITAGNQGSHHLNLIVKKIISQLDSYNIIHQTGKNDFKYFKKISQKRTNYFVSSYFETDDFSWIVNNSQIIISRSGANTSQEIVALNKKSVLIPLPKSQQDEQFLNALWVKDHIPNTIIIKDEDLTPQNLLDSIRQLSKINIKSKDRNDKPNDKLLQLIHEII